MDNEEKTRLSQERNRMKAKLAEGAVVIDPTVRIKFQNIEDPPSPGRPSPPLEFIVQTAKGFIMSFKISRSEEIQDTALRHGEVYDLPLSVVNHLNSVQTPVYGQKITKDGITGGTMIVNYIQGYRNRFACVAVDMGNYHVVDDGEKRTRDTRPSKKGEQERTNKELAALGSA